MAENGVLAATLAAAQYWLKRKESVPEKMPSIRSTRSPVSIRSASVLRTGRPAPTVASW